MAAAADGEVEGVCLGEVEDGADIAGGVGKEDGALGGGLGLDLGLGLGRAGDAYGVLLAGVSPSFDLFCVAFG